MIFLCSCFFSVMILFEAGEDRSMFLFHMFHVVLTETSAPFSKKKLPEFETTVKRPIPKKSQEENDSEIETFEFEIPEIDDPDMGETGFSRVVLGPEGFLLSQWLTF